MNGDPSVLLSKAVLDFFTAMIFACTLRQVVSLIAIPLFIVLISLFFCAQIIMPFTTQYMINDLIACGGFIMLATGFRIAKIKDFPIVSMIPSFYVILPLSWLWVTYTY